MPIIFFQIRPWLAIELVSQYVKLSIGLYRNVCYIFNRRHIFRHLFYTHFKFYIDMAYMVSAWFDWAIRVRRGWMGEAGVSLILNLIMVITATKCHISGYWVSFHSWICILDEQQQNLFYWELLLHKKSRRLGEWWRHRQLGYVCREQQSAGRSQGK